jgi:hypothetical protein
MEEKQIIRNKRQYNALEDKLSSQIKRIEELLKSGDIPWLRVKSVFIQFILRLILCVK